MKRTYGENKEIGVNVTARLPESLIKRADEYRIKNNIESRSGLIGEALEEYISSQKCPKCGSHNPANGTVCSVCGENIGELRETIAKIKEIRKNINEMMPVIRQKYNMCLTTVKALKIKDSYLLRHIDLISAKIVRDGEDDVPEFFFDSPKLNGSNEGPEIDYALYQNLLRTGEDIEEWCLEKIDSGDRNLISYLESVGYTRIEVARYLYQNLVNSRNNYREISSELDMIGEYLTEKGKEKEKAEK